MLEILETRKIAEKSMTKMSNSDRNGSEGSILNSPEKYDDIGQDEIELDESEINICEKVFESIENSSNNVNVDYIKNNNNKIF